MHLSKPIDYATPRMNLTENSGLQLITMYQDQFINYSKFTTLTQHVNNDEAGVAMIGL